MAEFHPLGIKVYKRFADLSRYELFETVHGDAVWDAYIAAFPAGTNPIFRQRTEHDCACCRNFIRNVGNAVAVVDGKLASVWSIKGLEEPYATVAAALDKMVTSAAISGLYRKSEKRYGAEFTLEQLEDKSVKRWHHFHGQIENLHFSREADAEKGKYRTTSEVFKRGLEELREEDFTTILNMIGVPNGLYRGAEFKASIKEFQKELLSYKKLKTQEAKDIFVWQMAARPIARFRNTLIGTLFQNLAAGDSLDEAVGKYEANVAPANYKRTSSIVTPGMVKEAMKTIKEMDLEDALARRHATINDISVNNVLWVDNADRAQMKGAIENILSKAMTMPAPKTDQAEDIAVEDFMKRIVPKASSMEVYVANQMEPNFVTLTAPVHADSARLFKWKNDFAWSYEGGVTDSIKARVKKAGGNTEAKLRVSLAWHNSDDLDLHVIEPDRNHIHFRNKCGKLDVDMNGMDKHDSEAPVENVSWTLVRDGLYRVFVHQYNKRNTSSTGFELEVEYAGKLYNFVYEKAVRDGEQVDVFDMVIDHGTLKINNVAKSLKGGSTSREVWNVETEKFVKVRTLMNSPNYWDDNEVGNRHTFFILEGCKTDTPARGIYNEFLNNKLDKHRKVFELLGDKTKITPTKDQLSGVGFSSTRGDKVMVRVAGAKSQKVFNVIF